MSPTRIWLRAETKPAEARAPLTPGDAATLIARGFDVTVEASTQRAFADPAYTKVGCTLAEAHSWPDAPQDCFILGLKELPEDDAELRHSHIYFAHAFKEQEGWQDILGRFQSGGGELLDLEYLVDEQNRRIAAFGYWAGFAGAALAVMAWCAQQLGQSPALANIGSWPNKNLLLAELRTQLATCVARAGTRPDLMIIGALGRVGRGVQALTQGLDLDTTGWDLAETAPGGPFPEILEHDIFVNCVLVGKPLPPFITGAGIEQAGRRLRVIADVSCDPFGDYNPIPLYSSCTDFASPTLRLAEGEPPLDLIAIDNLPSMLPRESSEDFSAQLLPALLKLAEQDNPMWLGARAHFLHHRNLLEQ